MYTYRGSPEPPDSRGGRRCNDPVEERCAEGGLERPALGEDDDLHLYTYIYIPPFLKTSSCSNEIILESALLCLLDSLNTHYAVLMQVYSSEETNDCG
jgi:hypothetical protein